MGKKIGLALMTLFALGLSASAHSLQIIVNTSDNRLAVPYDNQGWWSPTEDNTPAGDNYITGRSGTSLYRSFFSFDLSALSGVVTAATLELRRFVFNSPDSDETIAFFDVTTNVTTLNNRTGANATIYDDLGTGVSFGSFALNVSMTPEVIAFTLNSNALTAIQASAGGWFSIGGALQSIDTSRTTGQEAIFSNSNGTDPQRLILEVADVPEPKTLALLSLGLAALGFGRHRAH